MDIIHDNVCSLCHPVTFHMLQLILTGRPISSCLEYTCLPNDGVGVGWFGKQ